MVSLTGPARDAAEALIAALPEETRGKFPAPENLAALVVSDSFLGQTAIEMQGQTTVDPLNTNLTVSGLEGGPKKISFQLGADGWQMVVPLSAIQGIKNKLAGSSSQMPSR